MSRPDNRAHTMACLLGKGHGKNSSYGNRGVLGKPLKLEVGFGKSNVWCLLARYKKWFMTVVYVDIITKELLHEAKKNCTLYIYMLFFF